MSGGTPRRCRARDTPGAPLLLMVTQALLSACAAPQYSPMVVVQQQRQSTGGGGPLGSTTTPPIGHSCNVVSVSTGGPVIGTTSITGVAGTTVAACCAACAAVPRCISFTLSIDSTTKQVCWLKDNAKNGSTCSHQRCISGTNGRKPVPPPPPCPTFPTRSACPAGRCSWVGSHCKKPPPPPPPPGPCSLAPQGECGVGVGPYNGTRVYCAAACVWNGTACNDRSPSAYTMPSNASLLALSGPSSPLLHMRNVVWSFYGDSITWVNRFEPVIQRHLAGGEGTQGLNISLRNQGINGGTAADLLTRGFSPWGHLDPTKKQSNISFQQTLERDR
eukprot:COSAG01_NODE_3844_length_5645_cov_8.301479_3_plen_332_part_00